MMISLNQIGKRFVRDWVFKGVCFSFEDTGHYGILGHNGAGKSTLMRIIAGMQNATAGVCTYHINGREVPSEKIFSYIAYCAPGMELIGEMTLEEFLRFHFSFKPLLPGVTLERIIDLLQLQKARNSPVHEYSSGMLQRVKLAQAFFSDVPILLLDEPCSNLDEAGIQLYQQLLAQYTQDRLVLIASNDEREYRHVKQSLRMDQFHA